MNLITRRDPFPSGNLSRPAFPGTAKVTPQFRSNSMTVRASAIKQEFLALYGAVPRVFHAPGRVNLIGEHTDYNEGFVLPMAIDKGTLVAIAPRPDRIIRVSSQNEKEAVTFNLDAPPKVHAPHWSKYVEGMARSLERQGLRLKGADILLSSDLPIGAGLSSSAALEISVGKALLEIAQLSLAPNLLAQAGMTAERQYVGTQCGIMDQLAVAEGKPDHLLLIDCGKQQVTPVPFKLQDYAVVVVNSMVKHSLASSEYNTRRAECNTGVKLLQKALPSIRSLRDVSLRDFQRHESLLPEPIRSRVRHVVTENQRVLDSSAALQRGDLPEFGRLMQQSHQSLRTDYQVSCPELDQLVDIASRFPGVLGARMTGGGFGGCTVNLVRKDAVEGFKQAISNAYQSATGRQPEIYTFTPSPGVQEVL